MNTAVQPGNHFQADCDRISFLMSFDPKLMPSDSPEIDALFTRHLKVAPAEVLAQVEILPKLDKRTLERMATDPSTPIVLLERLAAHPIGDVRAAVADNQNTPMHSMWALSTDADADVRYQLAENHSLPVDLICFLFNDENPYVASRAQQTFHRVHAH